MRALCLACLLLTFGCPGSSHIAHDGGSGDSPVWVMDWGLVYDLPSAQDLRSSDSHVYSDGQVDPDVRVRDSAPVRFDGPATGCPQGCTCRPGASSCGFTCGTRKITCTGTGVPEIGAYCQCQSGAPNICANVVTVSEGAGACLAAYNDNGCCP